MSGPIEGVRLASFPVESLFYRGSTVRVEARRHGVMHLVLVRSDVRNAFDETMIDELGKALDELREIDEPARLRLLLLSGEGRVFSAGADLRYMKRLGSRSFEESLEDARGLARLFYRLADFPTPVVAVVRGAAIGGGLGLAMTADYVLAEDNAVFATSEVRLGIVPGVISPYVVRKLGLAQASPVMLTGRRLGAAEARDMGLVQQVVSFAALEDALENVVRDHLQAGPEAARRTKALIKRSLPLPSAETIELTARAIAEARVSEEGRRGLEAFFQKTAPPWVSEPEKR